MQKIFIKYVAVIICLVICSRRKSRGKSTRSCREDVPRVSSMTLI